MDQRQTIGHGVSRVTGNGVFINLFVAAAALVAVGGMALPLMAPPGPGLWGEGSSATARAHTETRAIAAALWRYHELHQAWPDAKQRHHLVMATLGQGRIRTASLAPAVSAVTAADQRLGAGAPAVYLDPWARPYVIRMGPLGPHPMPGGDKAVVLSAGPNGVLETARTLSRAAHFGGDDVGVVFYVRNGEVS